MPVSRTYRILINLFIVFIFISCSREEPVFSEIDITELKEFETFVALDDLLLTTPSVIRFDGDSHLFVYENSRGTVLKLNEDGHVVNEFGRRGQGPGEVQMVNNIFLTETSLYIVDVWQFFIHRYDRNGEFLSSLDYGSLGYLPGTPRPPFSPTFLRAERIVNEPHVTLSGDVLLSPVNAGEPSDAVYKRKDWEGNHLSDVGAVPEGSSFTYDADKFRADILNREVPSFYKPNAFPVNDPANPDEYFLVYSSIPKITKYSADGERLWESEVRHVPEVDSVATRFYETMERMQRSGSDNRINLSFYNAGVSSMEGDLYLSVKLKDLWLHRFDSEGTLVHRYKILSEDAEVLPIFDIDFTGRRIFVVTEDGEIRVYVFQEVF